MPRSKPFPAELSRFIFSVRKRERYGFFLRAVMPKGVVETENFIAADGVLDVHARISVPVIIGTLALVAFEISAGVS